jgi:hypothetical protein
MLMAYGLDLPLHSYAGAQHERGRQPAKQTNLVAPFLKGILAHEKLLPRNNPSSVRYRTERSGIKGGRSKASSCSDKREVP